MDEAGAVLLTLARQAVEAWVREGRWVRTPEGGAEWARPRGVFVSLHRQGCLRGCIGYPHPVKPLGEALIQAAVCAAVQDARFPPVELGELPELDYEVTLLEPPRVAAASEVVPGRHGLIVSHQGRRGLLLPQVAAEHGWDAAQFLAQTCRKAGLPAEAWQTGARIEVFEARRFVEQEDGPGRPPAEEA